MKTMSQLRKNCKLNREHLKPHTCALLGDNATQFLATALVGTAYEVGVDLQLYDADYNQIEAQIIDDDSELNKLQPQSVIICMCSEKIYEQFCGLAYEQRKNFAEMAAERILLYWETLYSKFAPNIIQFSFAELNDFIWGNFALKKEESFLFQVKKLNFLLMNMAKQKKNIFLFDINSIYMQFGYSEVFDPRLYYTSKIVFSLEILPQIAKGIVDIVKAMLGIGIKKCVICDLDNTLWGGVISEEGISGVEIGEVGRGAIFSELQKWLKELKGRGILLGVCSKNDEKIAKEVFVKHPENVLKLEDFAIFVANWENKAENIKYIQEKLNIGMDSIVFIDDNPFEREVVRKLIGLDICVPELPEEAAQYLECLKQLNLFETISFSEEDKTRTKQYQIEANRIKEQELHLSYDDYLESLEMFAEVRPFEEFYYSRIAQLSQRSNQFNLRTGRYSEEDIAVLAVSKEYITMYFTLKDKFGEYGLISVVILKRENEDTVFIQEWFMSCRVLKRGMEGFIMNIIIEEAKKKGYAKVCGEYIPTTKNGMVEKLYEQFGFDSLGRGKYSININQYTTEKVYIKILGNTL